MATPRLTVLAGPMAVGKGTIIQAFRSRHPELAASVSVTARAPRPGEIDGAHYHFLNGSQFDELVGDGGVLEWAKVHGLHRYGTLYRLVKEALTAGKSVPLEIDLDGARRVHRPIPEAYFASLAPPSWDVLIACLLGRGTEDKEERARRLETAKTELTAESESDVAVMNDDLDVAVTELARVMGLE